MNSHVAQERHTMFQESADNVRRMLIDMVKDVGAMMDDKADEVFVHMKRDYRAVLGGGEVQQDGEILPKTQRLARKEIMCILDGVEKKYMKVAGLEVEEEEKDQDDRAEETENQTPASDSGSGDRKEVKSQGKDVDGAVKREKTASGQLDSEKEVPSAAAQSEAAASADDESMTDASSSDESEPKLRSSEAQQVLEGTISSKVEEEEDPSSSSEASDSE